MKEGYSLATALAVKRVSFKGEQYINLNDVLELLNEVAQHHEERGELKGKEALDCLSLAFQFSF